VQVIAKRTLRQFWERYPQAEIPLRAWFGMVSGARWNGPADVKALFRSADFVGDNRVIFDIGGNKFRLIVHVAYRHGRVLVKFIGTHDDYDKINPETV
jgi:mRNA interferase HigB